MGSTTVIGSLLLAWLLPAAHGGKVTNGLIDTEFTQECFYNKSVDVVLLLDGSGSVGDNTFGSQIDFAIMFARRLGVAEAGTHLALAQFSDESRLEIGLGQYTAEAQLESAIQRVPFLGGGTLTGQALAFVQREAFRGARGGDVPRIAVVVSDGQSQDDVITAAQALRESGVTVYTVGITNLVDVHELHEIAGNPSRTFTVESLSEVDEPLVKSITLDMCKTDFRPGEPEIICGPDHIGVRAATKDPFDGFVFVQDHFHDEECRAGAADFEDSRMISLTIPFNKCNVHRYRSVDPKGIYVEATIVFMFHMTFMTQVDHMVEVKCFYMEAEKNVTIPMEVSMIPTQFREKMYQMPTCYYTLRKGAPDGPELEYAQLGDEVYHRWECIEEKDYDTFGMLVHSCYVDNGYGDRVDILNDKGCGLDPVLLQTPDYDDRLHLATKPYHVFKYADRPVLQFQCQITLCIKYDGGCTGITPPACPPSADDHHHHHLGKRKRRNGGGEEDEDEISALSPPVRRETFESEQRRIATLDVFTNAVTVFEKSPACDSSNVDRTTAPPFTVDPLHLAMLTSLNIVIAVSSVVIWCTIMRWGTRRIFHIA